MKVSELIKKLIDNPDDLSVLPEILTHVESLEETETVLLEKVDKLHESNKKYLKMIPINEPPAEPEPEPVKIPSLKEVATSLIGKE